MPLFNLLGNAVAQRMIARMLEQQRVPNTLLFAGPEGVGKSLAALNLIAELFGCPHAVKIEKGIHPDVHIYKPEGKSGLHAISTLRQLIEEMQLPPFEASRKAFIIHDAERMLPSASNALLKTFEEPQQDSTVILLSSDPESLLPTILSRCQKIPFFPVAEEEIFRIALEDWRLSEAQARRIATAAQGSVGKAKRLIQHEENPARQALLLLLSRPVPYPEIAQRLVEIENLLAPPEEEEHPGEWQKSLDAVFQDVFYWFRDRHQMQLNAGQSFHAQALESLQQCTLPLPSLETVASVLSECRLAAQRNMKLRTVFEYLLFKLVL